MSNIIGTVYKSDSKTEYTTDTYLHLNGAVLLIHHWVGETDDGYMDEWSISHGMLSGEKDLSIIWYAYHHGYVDVSSYKYPEGFDIQKLREIVKEEFNIIVPNDISNRALEASLKAIKDRDVFEDSNEELEG